MKTRYVLNGHLTLLAPLAITMPGTQPATAKDSQPPPVTTIYIEGQGLTDTVYMPSTSFRGPLRRAGLEAIIRARKGAGLPSQLDLRSYYSLAIGGTRGRASGGLNYDVGARQALRDRNVQVAVFGAADVGDLYFVPSRLSIDHGLPREPIAVTACPEFPGMRTDDMLRSPEKVLPLLDTQGASVWEMMHRASTEASALKKQRKGLVAQARAAKDAEEKQRINREMREIDAALEDGGQSVAMPLAGYRAIPQGAVLAHRMELDSDRPAELGLLLAALQGLGREPVLGGHRAQGCGRFRGTWTLTRVDESGRQDLGDVVIDGEGGVTLPQGEAIAAAAAAFDEACRNGDFAYRHPAATETASDD